MVDNRGLSVASSWLITILKTQWTVDYITIPPPDPNAPPPPPGLVDEQPRLNELYSHVTERKWRDNWMAPLPLPLNVSGYFGEQRSFNGGPVQGHHGGTDLAADEGTPIFATNDGVVVMADRVLNRGNCVVVDHGSGVFSCYGHQSEMKVQVGQALAQGETLGLVGTTGLSTGPHLHWEIRLAGSSSMVFAGWTGPRVSKPRSRSIGAPVASRPPMCDSFHNRWRPWGRDSLTAPGKAPRRPG